MRSCCALLSVVLNLFCHAADSKNESVMQKLDTNIRNAFSRSTLRPKIISSQVMLSWVHRYPELRQDKVDMVAPVLSQVIMLRNLCKDFRVPLRDFIAAGVPVNQVGRDGGSALAKACSHGKPKIVRLLLKNKAHCVNGNEDALSIALKDPGPGGVIVSLLLNDYGMNEIVSGLSSYKPELSYVFQALNARYNLSWQAQQQDDYYPEIMRDLLERGAQVIKKDIKEAIRYDLQNNYELKILDAKSSLATLMPYISKEDVDTLVKDYQLSQIVLDEKCRNGPGRNYCQTPLYPSGQTNCSDCASKWYQKSCEDYLMTTAVAYYKREEIRKILLRFLLSCVASMVSDYAS